MSSRGMPCQRLGLVVAHGCSGCWGLPALQEVGVVESFQFVGVGDVVEGGGASGLGEGRVAVCVQPRRQLGVDAAEPFGAAVEQGGDHLDGVGAAEDGLGGIGAAVHATAGRERQAGAAVEDGERMEPHRELRRGGQGEVAVDVEGVEAESGW